MTRRMEGYFYAIYNARLAVALRRYLRFVTESNARKPLAFSRDKIILISAISMVSVSVRENGFPDRFPGVDVEIPPFAVKSTGG